MKLKEIDRTVNIAWSPSVHHPVYIAAGTSAQQLDSSFSTSATLEIYHLSLTEPGYELPIKVSLPVDHRFQKLVWTEFGMKEESPSGVIIGGTDNGSLYFYDAYKLMQKQQAVICQQSKHSGPVRALDVNPFMANLIASGGGESEILIWDLNKLKSPDNPMAPGARAQPSDDVTCVSWNRQVQHILASSFSGRTVIWDLRKSDPIIKIATSRVRCREVCWHPDVATQLCLASEDDSNPVIQLWDLRFAGSPVRTLESHQSGVLSVSWCAQDSDLLLSCGKDNRIICWNPNFANPTGEVLCELTASSQWNFNVQWCPKNPGLISCSSFEGNVGIYSLLGGQQQVTNSNKVMDSFGGMANLGPTPTPTTQTVTVSLSKPPKWLKKPCGARFSFGGKLVSCDSSSKVVNVSQVITEPELVERSASLEMTLAEGNLNIYCQHKHNVASSTEDKELWRYLEARFSQNPRQQYLNLLGLNQAEITNKLKKTIISEKHQADDGSLQNSTNDAGSVFDSIVDKIQENESEAPLKPFIIPRDDKDGEISEALLTGDLELAVELCLNDGRMADAIILSLAGPPELIQATQNKYFKSLDGGVGELIRGIVRKDWSRIVLNCDISCWKEVLAALVTYADQSQFPSLCESLGYRLETERNGALARYAVPCYICAGSMNRVVSCWSKKEEPLQDMIERVMILKKSIEMTGDKVDIDSGSLAKGLREYALLLSGQGRLDTALRYLADIDESSISELKERLSIALGYSHKQRATQSYRQQQPSTMRPAPVSAQAPVSAPAPVPAPTQSPGIFYPQSTTPTNVASKARSRYVVDPSISSGGSFPLQTGYTYDSYQPLPVPNTQPQQTYFTPQAPVTTQPPQPAWNPPQQPPQSGWNDPPPVLAKPKPKPTFEQQMPIMQPLLNPAEAQQPPYQQHPPTYHQQQPQQQHIPYQQPTHLFNQVNGSVAEQQKPEVQQPPTPPPPQPKPEVSPELKPLSDRLHDLQIRCAQTANNNPMKRKLEDVSRKLEVLDDKLRAHSLSPVSLQGLQDMVSFISQGDYHSALTCHTQICSTAPFSEISGFMPGLKTLFQVAMQLGVYTQ